MIRTQLMAAEILVAEMPEGRGRDLAIERAHLPEGARIRRFTWQGDARALAEACRGAQAVLTDYVPFTREVLADVEGLRMISVAATGWDCVNTAAAKEFGIAVTSVADYCTDEVADHTLALLLALNRRLRDYDRQVQRDHSWRWDDIRDIRPLKGQTLGLIGCGRIGRAVARRAQAFGLRVIAFDPFIDAASAREVGIAPVGYDELLAGSDIISLHCALGPHNAGMLDARAFAAMARRPLLINVARGALVVERDLVAALDAGQLTAAALDVLAEDSPDLANHPLCGRDDVLLTPHIAFYSDGSLASLRRISADNIRHFLQGRPEMVSRLIVDPTAVHDHRAGTVE